MRVLVSRVHKAQVLVENKTIGKIEQGLVCLVCFHKNDTLEDIDYLVHKLLHMRILDDNSGNKDQSILDQNGAILSISQFTLYANTMRGNRPSYDEAMEKEKAHQFYEIWNQKLKEYVRVETGKFAQHMLISAEYDGPVTIMLESRKTNDKK